MSEWNAMSPEGRDALVRTLRQQGEALLALAGEPGAWEAPTACPDWQVRDIVGHLVDVTESYFTGFAVARGEGTAGTPLGLAIMATHLDENARAFRGIPQADMVARLRTDLDTMTKIAESLTPEEWTGLSVPHGYMGPLPAFFYPAFQLMDYAVHLWDVREGTGRAHGLDGDAADLLVPFMFILWQATATTGPDTPATSVGIRVTGRNGGDTRVTVGPDGFAFEPGDLSDAPAVLEFDPGSFVLTAFGRGNFGTVRGDRETAERFLNLFFRI